MVTGECWLFRNLKEALHSSTKSSCVMATNIARREWLKKSSLAALGLGFSLRSIAGEDNLPINFGSERGLVNLGSNESPYGISAHAKQAIINMISQANRYYTNVPALAAFKKEIADYNKVSPEQVLITAGSGQALGLLARHFSKGNIVAPDITFGILPNTAKTIGTPVIEVPLTYDKVHDLPAMLQAINRDTQLVYVCNPANPTSTIVKPAALKSFVEEAAKKTVVLVDEAYIDYLDAPDNESMIGLIDKNPNLIVLRTFSKIYGMAGLRVGYVVGNPALIEKLDDNYFMNTQFYVSNPSLAAAQAGLKDEEHKKMSKQKNAAVRKYVYDELTGMKFRCIPSYTNFQFFNLGNYAGDFAADMLKKNFLLRSNTYRDGKWARVSLGTMEEMKLFVSALKGTKA
jgi:histidinol-phosphate aminotransferase